jgi:hypothetical protein
MAESFNSNPPEKRNWLPFVIGLVVVLVVAAIVIGLTRKKGATTSETNPYTAKLQIGSPKMSAAQNYVGGTVTYLDVNIANTGDMWLSGAAMKLTFNNSMGQVVQTETVPVHVLVQNQMGGYPDQVDLARAPVGPGESCTVRMTLEHISADWNQHYPEMQLVNLDLKLK